MSFRGAAQERLNPTFPALIPNKVGTSAAFASRAATPQPQMGIREVWVVVQGVNWCRARWYEIYRGVGSHIVSTQYHPPTTKGIHQRPSQPRYFNHPPFYIRNTQLSALRHWSQIRANNPTPPCLSQSRSSYLPVNDFRNKPIIKRVTVSGAFIDIGENSHSRNYNFHYESATSVYKGQKLANKLLSLWYFFRKFTLNYQHFCFIYENLDS